MSSCLIYKALIFTFFISLTHCEAEQLFRKKFVFSDKTAYHFLNETISRPSRCNPVYVNMVLRHGSRYPAKSRVSNMGWFLRRLNSFLSLNNRANATFRYKGLTLPWEIPLDVRNSASKELSRLGAQEMYWIAKRLRERFPELFKKDYSNRDYSFIATDKLRSSQSAVAFAQGIFEQRGPVELGKYQPIAIQSSGPADRDQVLRIYEACPKWKKENAKSTISEYSKFIHGPRVRNVTEKIAKRLNLNNKPNLITPKDVVELYLMCAFGTQTDSNDVSLCSLFEDDDLEVMEYLNDLKIYWSYGRGRKINYKMACLLYKKIIESFEQYMRRRRPSGVFQFAHTGTVVPLLTSLGLFTDDLPLRADNFIVQGKREFRPSNIVPMSANVAFVLYECNKTRWGMNSRSRISRVMKIQVIVNEVAVKIPACGKTHCPLKKFLDYYSRIRNRCNMNNVCGRLRKSCG
ncbi:multiple inositol polyphosphate phosphatase 1-like [Dendronephthya gigantea]|uniref:multiple inositol polyphosphate phosphatase 1-like n=1 Tax=Dendronephthya gigantea TaxID=151771 RepID=UPI00106C7134|nr:multiple inositol polyphosphate phosphatase 1-like [Dendronephthya gigantea]